MRIFISILYVIFLFLLQTASLPLQVPVRFFASILLPIVANSWCYIRVDYGTSSRRVVLSRWFILCHVNIALFRGFHCDN
jgi:hypothetical protein